MILVHINQSSDPELESLRHEIEALDDYIRRTNERVSAIDDCAGRTQQQLDEFGRRKFKAEISPGLGWVVLSGTGKLVKVDLDADRLRYADYATLGERIVSTIGKAAEAITQARQAMIETEYRNLRL